MKIKLGMEQEYINYVKINSHDHYSKEVVDIGERWAILMEKQMAEGKKIADIADTTIHEVNSKDITIFMYKCVISALIQFWEHGEILKLWHNLNMQIDGENEEVSVEDIREVNKNEIMLIYDSFFKFLNKIYQENIDLYFISGKCQICKQDTIVKREDEDKVNICQKCLLKGD